MRLDVNVVQTVTIPQVLQGHAPLLCLALLAVQASKLYLLCTGIRRRLQRKHALALLP